MTLESYVRADLIKLRARLKKSGMADIASMEYPKYLQSTLWRKIREWVIQRDKFCCVICLRSQHGRFDEFDIHHRDYALLTLEGGNPEQLITLCRKCHKRVEYYSNGSKRSSLIEKEKEYQRLSALHHRVKNEGMSIKIESKSIRSSSQFFISYVGPFEFLEFYTVERLMISFTSDLYTSNKPRLRLPLPFRTEKFRQTSGANIIDTTSNKSVIKINCSDESAVIKASKEFSTIAETCLQKAVTQSIYWKLVQ